jgi:flagellin-like hook-associated protein FlgL
MDAVTVTQVDQFTAYLGRGDGTFTTGISGASTDRSVDMVVARDYDGDGFLDVLTTGSSATVLRGNGDGVLDMYGLNFGSRYNIFSSGTIRTAQEAEVYIGSQSGARSALESLKTVQGRIEAELSQIGAYRSRIEAAYAVTSATRLQSSRCESSRL